MKYSDITAFSQNLIKMDFDEIFYKKVFIYLERNMEPRIGTEIANPKHRPL